MENLDLTVIILSYNTKDITHKCLLKVMDAKNYCEQKLKNKIKIIVLDNASEDGSAQMIKENHPQFKLIVSKENLGFSKGNNLLMKQTKTPFILLLNSDVYLEQESLYKTLAYFRVNLNCDVLGARLKYASGKLQSSSGNLPTPINLVFWILGLSLLPTVKYFIPPFHPRDKGFFAKAHQVGWIMGAFFALKRQVFVNVGGFDENLFMHMEEVEWCQRIKGLGYKIWYVPSVEAVHLHGASTNFDLSSSLLNELKGVKYYLQKYYPNFYLLTRLFLILGLILRIIVFSILRKKERSGVYMKGLAYV